MTRAIASLLVTAGLGVACADDAGRAGPCEPGARVECACPGDGAGEQVCSADGKSFGACTGCPGAGGSGGAGGAGGSGAGGTAGAAGWPEYAANPYVFDLDFEVPAGTALGSIFAYELDADGLLDFVVTGAQTVAAYDHWGKLLWLETTPIRLSESANGGQGYPGRHAPGAIAGDVDGDGAAEVVYLTDAGVIRIHDGKTGALQNSGLEQAFSFPGAEAIAIANFRGLGDRDALLQYSQSEIRAISLEDGQTLWHVTDWTGIEHSAVRTADVTGDDRDEVVGPSFLGADGARLNAWDLQAERGTHYGGLDSLAIGDIVPGGPLEVALAETAPDESGIGIQSGEAIVVNPDAIVWGSLRPSGDIPPTGQCATEKDPDKLAVGDFDPNRPGLEVFARSACARHPWVIDSTGAIVASWNVSDTAPAGWFLGGPPVDGSEGGIDAITPIQWHGSQQQHVLLRERHLEGKAAIVNPMDGAFLDVFDVTAARSYVADVAGDYREEAIIVETRSGANGRVMIYWNAEPNSESRSRFWDQPHYRRIKQNYNYYSP